MSFEFDKYTKERNGVYTHNFDIINPSSQIVNVTEVVTIRKYTTRHKSDITRYIENTVREINLGKDSEHFYPLNRVNSVKSEILGIDGSVDTMLMWDLITKKESSPILKTVTEGFYDERERECVVSISRGIIVTDYIESSKQNKTQEEKFWYDTALELEKLKELDLGRWWDLNLFLTEGELPKYEDIVLNIIQRNNSDVVKTYTEFDFGLQRDMIRFLKPIYDTLQDMEVVDNLVDTTKLETQRLAYNTLKSYKKALEDPYLKHLMQGGFVLDNFVSDEI